jgi:hypothetical protein
MIMVIIAIIIIIIIIISLWGYEDLYRGFFYLEKRTFFSLLKFIHLFSYVSVLRMNKLDSSSSTIL